MKRYYSDFERFSQPTAEEIKRKAALSKKANKEKGKTYNPVTTSTRAITNSWWGNAWCQNLERYADYESRISRGRRYVRAGAVVDLEIKKGKVTARVQGTRKTPYKVEIRISPLSEERCQEILSKTTVRIETLEDLVVGEFPQSMKELFLEEGGLFPEPREISFNCSCPDWALMCKHVAAALYGIGVRLDDDPLLFFELRGIDVSKFIDVAIASRVEEMLLNESCESPRIIRDDDIMELFGVV